MSTVNSPPGSILLLFKTAGLPEIVRVCWNVFDRPCAHTHGLDGESCTT